MLISGTLVASRLLIQTFVESDDSLHPPSRHTRPRWLVVVAGVWLVASGLVVVHNALSQAVACIGGSLIAAAGLWSLYVPRMRWLATGISLGVFAAVVLVRHAGVSEIWSDGWATIVAFAASLLPGEPAAWTGRRAWRDEGGGGRSPQRS
jgi:hypothetical protein